MNPSRKELINKINDEHFDIIVIGGGSSGLGVAIDAVSRGLKVALFEKYDFSKGTSSRATKLVHGGVRYLQQGDVFLVREALKERAYMEKRAPHLVRKQEFIIPAYRWYEGAMYYIGLKLYDWLSGRYSLGSSSWLSKDEVLAFMPNLKSKGLKGGVSYFDGQFNDSRLAMDLAKTINSKGSVCINYMAVTQILKENGKVTGIEIKDELSDETHKITCSTVVNATGVFSDDILQMDNPGKRKTILPSRGSHIVLDASFLASKQALMIPKTSDGRVLFIVPWLGKVIAGTTDIKQEEAAIEPYAREEEIDFILETAQAYLSKKPIRKDILATFAGLRPLAAPKEGSTKSKEVSRSHKVIVSKSGLVSIIGGKWTTFRKMGEDVLDKINKRFSKGYKESSSLSLDIFKSDTTEHYSSKTIHPSLPYTEKDFDIIIEQDMVFRLDDILARRTRCLFLDAKATLEIAPLILRKLTLAHSKDSIWEEEELSSFTELVRNYLPNP